MEPSAIPDPMEAVLRRHGAFVRALAQRMVRDPALADDVAQMTWTRWIERGPSERGARGERGGRGWLRTVVGNLARNALRSRERRERHEALAARPERARSGAEEAEQAEVLRHLVAAVLELPPEQRDTLLGLYFRGLDAPALARESGVPLATLRDRRRRALERLRHRLDRELGGGAWGTAMLRLGGEGGGAVAAATGAVATVAVAKWALGAAAVALVALGVRALVRDGGAAPRASEIVTLVDGRAEAGEPRAAAPRAHARPEPPSARAAIAPGPPEPDPAPEALTGADPALAEVRGRLVLSDGRPATDVEVRVELGGEIQRNGELADRPYPEDWSDVETSTDPDGRFALAFAPSSDFATEVSAQLPGHARVVWDLSVVAPGATKDLGEATLFRSATLEGRVVDRSGTPLVGVEWRVSVRSLGLGGTNGREEVRGGATCDPLTASFLVEGLAPGPNALEVSAGLADRIRPPRVVLEEGALAHVDVVYDGADPARRILVSPSVRTFHPQRPSHERVRILVPGAEPRAATELAGWASAYVFDDLAPGAYTVVIDDERFEPWSQGGVAPGTKVRAELTGSAALVLDVVDGTTAERVERYSVRVRTARNTFPNEFVVWDGETPLAGGRVTGLVPGEIGLVVTAGERTAELALDPLAPGEVRPVRVELQRPCRLAGTVRDPSGVPLSGISLLLVRPAEVEDSPASLLTRAGAIGYPVERHRHEIAATRSDADGAFDFVVPTAGTLLVYADAQGSAVDLGAAFTLAPGEAREGVELVHAPPGRLLGRVLAPGGRAVAGLRVLVTAADEAATWLPRALTLGVDGRFELDVLPAGPVRVYLIGPQTLQHRAGG